MVLYNTCFSSPFLYVTIHIASSSHRPTTNSILIRERSAAHHRPHLEPYCCGFCVCTNKQPSVLFREHTKTMKNMPSHHPCLDLRSAASLRCDRLLSSTAARPASAGAYWAVDAVETSESPSVTRSTIRICALPPLHSPHRVSTSDAATVSR